MHTLSLSRALTLSASIVTAVSLAATMAGAQAPPTMSFSQKEFTDVSSSYRYYDAIEYLRTRNIIKGYLDGTFKPDSRMNRAEFMMLMTNDFFLSDTDSSCVTKHTSSTSGNVFFPDVAGDSWYGQAVCIGKTRDLIHGYPDGTFKPGDSVSVVEAAKVVVRVFALSTPQDDTPSDVHWYQVYMDELIKHNAVPATIGTADYGRPITRGEIVQMIYLLKQTQGNQ